MLKRVLEDNFEPPIQKTVKRYEDESDNIITLVGSIDKEEVYDLKVVLTLVLVAQKLL